MSRIPTRNGRLLRWRGKLGVLLLTVVRGLLEVRPSDGDLDTCVYCGGRVREGWAPQHAADCPSLTKLFPVTLRDLWPYGPSSCMTCETQFWPGDHYTLRLTDNEVSEVVCLGCAAHDSLADAMERYEGEGGS